MHRAARHAPPHLPAQLPQTHPCLSALLPVPERIAPARPAPHRPPHSQTQPHLPASSLSTTVSGEPREPRTAHAARALRACAAGRLSHVLASRDSSWLSLERQTRSPGCERGTSTRNEGQCTHKVLLCRRCTPGKQSEEGSRPTTDVSKQMRVPGPPPHTQTLHRGAHKGQIWCDRKRRAAAARAARTWMRRPSTCPGPNTTVTRTPPCASCPAAPASWPWGGAGGGVMTVPGGTGRPCVVRRSYTLPPARARGGGGASARVRVCKHPCAVQCSTEDGQACCERFGGRGQAGSAHLPRAPPVPRGQTPARPRAAAGPTAPAAPARRRRWPRRARQTPHAPYDETEERVHPHN